MGLWKEPESNPVESGLRHRYKHPSAEIKSYPTLKLYAKDSELHTRILVIYTIGLVPISSLWFIWGTWTCHRSYKGKGMSPNFRMSCWGKVCNSDRGSVSRNETLAIPRGSLLRAPPPKSSPFRQPMYRSKGIWFRKRCSSFLCPPLNQPRKDTLKKTPFSSTFHSYGLPFSPGTQSPGSGQEERSHRWRVQDNSNEGACRDRVIPSYV